VCGIAGSISINGLTSKELLTLSEGIRHRGPDSDGIYLHSSQYSISTTAKDLIHGNFESNCISLIHRRLSIIDLSSRSAQPFISEDGNVVLAFNGEVYNYIEIRKELELLGDFFFTDSDTEVVLKAYMRYGVECFKKFNGFWAISILDKSKKVVILSRDYFGKKPLYLLPTKGGIFFSSELKPLVTLIDNPSVHAQAAFDYLVFDQRDAYTATLFDGIEEVSPGTYQVYTFEGKKVNEEVFWTLPPIESSQMSYGDISEEYNRLFDKSVKLRLRADVPIDINLSGGLDSAAIALSTAKQFSHNVGCHTFRFDGDGNDESPQAQSIADALGLKLDVISLSQEEVWNNISEYIHISEEPVHSPTTFVQQAAWSSIAKEGYKVILHGGGNDEFLCGYQYFEQIRALSMMKQGKYLEYFRTSKYGLKTNLGRVFKWQMLGKNIANEHHLSSLYKADFISDLFSQCNSQRYSSRVQELARVNSDCDIRRRADIEYLRFPYWNKLMDKNSMSIPIEVRMPYLDKELASFVMTLSENQLFGNGFTKKLLRDYIGNQLPQAITKNHVKVGFQTPDELWMNRFKSRILDEITESGVQDYIDLDFIKQNYHSMPARALWRIYNFSLWKTKFIGK